MKPKVLLTKIFQNEAFGSLQRKEGIAKLSEIAELSPAVTETAPPAPVS